ncbi:hypothetical protein SLS62_005408 [Diatrype stigma]|uniref:O-methyltransferase domain-containing protein n=1 Tax=Diatrype stigma TaxID=117547 RepID=A0AAN9V0P9_9PEZI
MSITQQDAAELTGKLEAISINPDLILALDNDATRRRLCEAARKLSYALEAQGDTVWRVEMSPLELVLARIGVQTKIFEVLSNEPEGSTLCNEEVAQKSDVDPALLKRLLRYYQSYGMVAQPEDDRYAASRITKHLASKLGREGLRPFLDVVDMRELARGADASTPIFVDVGGAAGHQCIAVRDKYPDLAGRIILEDMAHVLDQVKANPLPSFGGIETEPYDFFKQEQPVKGMSSIISIPISNISA